MESRAVAANGGATPHLCALHIRRVMLRITLLDDWGTHSLTDQQRLDLLEIFEDRYKRRSTLITAQLPVAKWHDMIGEPTTS